MSTAETVVISVEATGFALAALAVAREAIKRPWIKFSWSASLAILPADKRDPAPVATAATKSSAVPAAGSEAPVGTADPAQIRPAA